MDNDLVTYCYAVVQSSGASAEWTPRSLAELREDLASNQASRGQALARIEASGTVVRTLSFVACYDDEPEE